MNVSHRTVITVCAVVLIASGCVRQRVVRPQVASGGARGSARYGAASPGDLSEYIRAVLRISQRNTEAESEALKKLLAEKPQLAALQQRVLENIDDADARKQLAAACVQAGLYFYASQLYQETLALLPADAAAERALANIWDRWEDYSLARQHAERAVELDPQSAEGLGLLGRINLHRNDAAAAIPPLLAAVRLAPSDETLLNDLGYAFLSQGSFSQARLYLEQAVASGKAPAETRNNLGIALARLGDRNGALQQFTNGSHPAAALNNLGVVSLAQKNWLEAYQFFEQALRAQPNYFKAQHNLSEAQLHLPLPTIVDLPSFGTAQGNSVAAGQTAFRSVPLAGAVVVDFARGVDSIQSPAQPPLGTSKLEASHAKQTLQKDSSLNLAPRSLQARRNINDIAIPRRSTWLAETWPVAVFDEAKPEIESGARSDRKSSEGPTVGPSSRDLASSVGLSAAALDPAPRVANFALPWLSPQIPTLLPESAFPTVPDSAGGRRAGGAQVKQGGESQAISKEIIAARQSLAAHSETSVRQNHDLGSSRRDLTATIAPRTHTSAVQLPARVKELQIWTRSLEPQALVEPVEQVEQVEPAEPAVPGNESHWNASSSETGADDAGAVTPGAATAGSNYLAPEPARATLAASKVEDRSDSRHPNLGRVTEHLVLGLLIGVGFGACIGFASAGLSGLAVGAPLGALLGDILLRFI